ncbi:MAG: LPS assembly lipoprotein LptE [Gammaproteobacteria bacterium]|nr:LPS assembly lipoprotein LptE [Gammaproteobacteria bacterium]
MTRFLSNAFVSLLFLAVVGCGFHLRGAADLPANLKTMYIQGTDIQQDFGLALKRALSANGVTVLTDYQQGSAVLTVLENKTERRVLSVGTDAKVSEYGLHGSVRFKVSDDQGQVILDQQSVEAQRDYQFNQDQVLASGNEESALREQLNQQLAQSVLRRLSVLK